MYKLWQRKKISAYIDVINLSTKVFKVAAKMLIAMDKEESVSVDM